MIKQDSKRAIPAPPADQDLVRLIEACSTVNGIAIEPGWQEQVQAHLKVAFAMAALVEREDLPDQAEPLPVFTA
jgi:hypothetical protein